MSKVNYIKQTSSPTVPVGANIGDEWFNSSTNRLYKLLARPGSTPAWYEVLMTPDSHTELNSEITLGNTDVTDINVELIGNFDINNGALRFDSASGSLRLSGVDTDIILKGITNEPPSATTDNLTVYSKNVGGRMLLKIKGPSGFDTPLQPLLALNKISWWNPPGNSTTVPGVLGFDAPTAQGTATARNVAATNIFTRTRRLGYVSGTVAGNLAGHYSTTAQYTLGDGAGLGGFYYVCRFGMSDTTFTTTARMFIGLTSAVGAPTNVDPATLTNCIGVGCSSDTSGLLLYYGGSAAQTPITLGATDFPTNSGANSTVGYELILFSPTNVNNVVSYRVTNLNTGVSSSGTITAATPGTQLPASTTFLAHRIWRTNNATTNAVGVDVISLYIESDT